MSKTAQRKLSLFQQGFNDAKTGGAYRWAKHPYLTDYDQGFRKGTEKQSAKRNIRFEIGMLMGGLAIGCVFSLAMFIR
jgi:hypothetical protein